MISAERIIAYETGELSPPEMVEMFSEMIADGTVWHLQGSYGRTAAALIESGWIASDGTIDHDRIAEDTD